MNLVCLPGRPCDQAVHAIKFMSGALRPLIEIGTPGDPHNQKIIGLALCKENQLLFLNRCPFCGSDLFIPPDPGNRQTGLTEKGVVK